jgi:hypothetical protein
LRIQRSMSSNPDDPEYRHDGELPVQPASPPWTICEPCD